MYKVNDIVVYKKDVCKVKEIKEDSKTHMNYYILNPINDDSLIIKIPTENKTGLIRNLISKKEIEEIINKIPEIEPLTNVDDKYIENTYKELLSGGSYEELIQIIKMAYIRNNERKEQNKKTSEKDDKYFNLAEKYLYSEFGVVLNMSFDETKEYIIKKVEANLA